MPLNKVRFFKEIDSTNNYVKSNYNTMDHRDIVVSEMQTGGRGRSDHNWMSPVGNLYFSYLLKEDISLNGLFKELSKISVSIVKCLKSYGIEASIKYPNDILVEKKKIAGILIETQGSGKLDYMVVGVGLNVNQDEFCDLSSKATSLSLENKMKYEINDVLSEIMMQYDLGVTFNEYVTHSMILNKKIRFNEQNFVVREILEDGRLLLDGDEKIYVSPNEISLKEIYE